MPVVAPTFLIVDFHAESRYLLAKTLRRKFAGAVIHETDDAEKAASVLRSDCVSAVILHRTFESTAAELVHTCRAIKPDVKIVMVSGILRKEDAEAAGVDAFLPYDEWLLLGGIVEKLLSGLHSGAPDADLV